MAEKRSFVRHKISHKVSFHDAFDVAEDVKDCIAVSEDVSRGGIRLRSGSIVANGRRLSLKIFNNSFSDPVIADAMVIWGHESINEGAVLGLSFTRMGWIESDRLFAPEVVSKHKTPPA